MANTIKCPSCQQMLRLAQVTGGRRIRCPACSAEFRVSIDGDQHSESSSQLPFSQSPPDLDDFTDQTAGDQTNFNAMGTGAPVPQSFSLNPYSAPTAFTPGPQRLDPDATLDDSQRKGVPWESRRNWISAYFLTLVLVTVQPRKTLREMKNWRCLGKACRFSLLSMLLAATFSATINLAIAVTIWFGSVGLTDIFAYFVGWSISGFVSWLAIFLIAAVATLALNVIKVNKSGYAATASGIFYMSGAWFYIFPLGFLALTPAIWMSSTLPAIQIASLIAPWAVFAIASIHLASVLRGIHNLSIGAAAGAVALTWLLGFCTWLGIAVFLVAACFGIFAFFA